MALIVFVMFVVAHAVSCTDFGTCSATCGGGTRGCMRQCINGNFGDIGCPFNLLYRTEVCNEQQCGKLLNYDKACAS